MEPQEKRTASDSVPKENIRHGEALFPCAVYLDQYQNGEDTFPWHWHEELEIAFVTQGMVTVSLHADQSGHMQSFSLRPGEGVFINRRIPHSYSGTDGEAALMPNLLFLPSLVYGSKDSVYWEKYLKRLLLSPSFSHVLLSPENSWQTALLKQAQAAFSLLSARDFGYEFRVRSALSEVLLLLLQNMAKAPDHAEEGSRHQADAERIRRMLSFIQEHYTELVSLQQIADSAFLGKRECLRCFQRTIGTSPMQYTIDLRLRRARQLLLETDLPLVDICTECGFQDQSYFIKAFRERMGTSPARFRKEAGAKASFLP